MKNYTHIRRALAGKLWYVYEQKMSEILAFFELKLSGGAASADVIAEIRAANQARKLRETELLAIQAFDQEDEMGRAQAARTKTHSTGAGGSVAVIPIYGMIMHRGSGMDISGPGATSCESLLQQIRQAVNDPNVKAIVLDVDSPGGDVDGVDELATEIYNARKQKKITAISDCLCASAAYYLASQATEMVVSPSSLTGSIGVYTMHEDDSKYLEDVGVKLTLIKFGENKAEGNNIEPLSASAQAHLQEMVDTFGVMFEKAVARGRKITQEDVHKKFGQGRVFDAKQAVRLGMADRVATLDEVLQGLGVSMQGPTASSQRSASAAADAPKVEVSADFKTSSEMVNEFLAVGPVTLVPCAAQAKKKSEDEAGTNDDENADVDDPDPDSDNGCACACKECKAGTCAACSCKDCACEGCTCDAATSAKKKAKQAIERRRLEMMALEN